MICENKLLCVLRNILIGLVLVASLCGTIIATVAIVCPNSLYSNTNAMQNTQILEQDSFRGWNLHSYKKPQNFFIES